MELNITRYLKSNHNINLLDTLDKINTAKEWFINMGFEPEYISNAGDESINALLLQYIDLDLWEYSLDVDNPESFNDEDNHSRLYCGDGQFYMYIGI